MLEPRSAVRSRCLAGGVVAAAIAGAAFVASVAAASGAARSRQNCDPPHSRTILSNRVERAFTLPGSYERVVYVCRYATGRSFKLGEWAFDARRRAGEGPYVWPILLEGRYVAYVSGVNGQTGYGRFSVLVADLATRRPIHRWDGSFGDGDQYLSRMVATPTGAVAWTVYTYPTIETDPHYQQTVRVSDRTREHAIVDTGTQIDVNSLTVRGRTASWLDAGQRREAVLR